MKFKRFVIVVPEDIAAAADDIARTLVKAEPSLNGVLRVKEMIAVESQRGMLMAGSIVSQRGGEGLVEVSFEDDGQTVASVQATCEQAREFALHILSAAEAGETDAMLLELLSDGKDSSKALAVLRRFREFRAVREKGRQH